MAALVKIDLRALVATMSMALQCMFKWERVRSSSIPTISGLRASHTSLLGFQASPAPAVVGEASHDISVLSFQSLVPALVALECADDEFAEAVQQMVALGAVVGKGDIAWSDSSLQWDSILAMYHAGFTTLSVSEFGETRVALKPEVVTWLSVLGLRCLVQTHLNRDLYVPLLKCSKLQLVMDLHVERFVLGLACGALRVGDALVYRAGFQRPLSYYVALLYRLHISPRATVVSRTTRLTVTIGVCCI